MESNQNNTEKIFERCLTAIRQDGRSIQDCLVPYPEQRRELEPLLRTAVRLKAAHTLHTSSDFRTESLQRLKALAISKPKPRKNLWAIFFTAFNSRRKGSPALTHLQPTFAYLFAGLLLVIIIAIGLGMVAASAQALPGDILYPVKRAQEDLQLNLTLNVADKADLHLEFANRRLDEAAVLITQKRTISLDQTLAEYSRHIQTEQAYLSPGSSLTPKQQSELADKVVAVMTHSETSLTALKPLAPSSSQSNLDTALTTSRDTYNQAIEVINNQNGNPPPTPVVPPPTTATPLPATPLPTSTRQSTQPSTAVRTSTTLPKPSTGGVHGTSTSTILPPSIRPTATLSITKVMPPSIVSPTPITNSSGKATATRPPPSNAIRPTSTP